MLILDEKKEEFPRIKVIGIGGGGGNAVGRMYAHGIESVEFSLINTDHQALEPSPVPEKIQIGESITKGLGTGGDVEIGSQSAEADTGMIHDILEGVDILFLTSCFGGGTGTGATPVVAREAREMGILCFAIVTRPFLFEGRRRSQIAYSGLQALHREVETVVSIPNDKLIDLAKENTPVLDAFRVADDFMTRTVLAIHRLITKPGLINLDFADIRAIMKEKGSSCIGLGEAEGKAKTLRAFESALNSPLLEKHGIEGARGILISVIGGGDLTLKEIHTAASKVQQAVHPDGNIIFGATIDDAYEDRVEVTLIATGIETGERQESSREEPTQEARRDAEQTVLDFSRYERGHFAKIEPTLHEGEDLDIPTFLRKKIKPGKKK